MALQNAFYIIGIIFMTIMLILIVALVASVFVIRAKIVSLHQKIDEKLALISDVTSIGKKIVNRAKSVVSKSS